MVLEAHLKLCVTGPDFLEILFAPKIRKMGRKWAKKVFFEFNEKFAY